jgi:hypothetical protein
VTERKIKGRSTLDQRRIKGRSTLNQGAIKEESKDDQPGTKNQPCIKEESKEGSIPTPSSEKKGSPLMPRPTDHQIKQTLIQLQRANQDLNQALQKQTKALSDLLDLLFQRTSSWCQDSLSTWTCSTPSPGSWDTGDCPEESRIGLWRSSNTSIADTKGDEALNLYPQDNSKALKLTIPQSLSDELDRIARERFTSRLGLIRYALREWIDSVRGQGSIWAESGSEKLPPTVIRGMAPDSLRG